MMDAEDEMLTELATLKSAIKRGLLVPVIRCKDCIHWDEIMSISTVTPEYHKCLRIPYHTNTADGYCDRAERREKG